LVQRRNGEGRDFNGGGGKVGKGKVGE